MTCLLVRNFVFKIQLDLFQPFYRHHAEEEDLKKCSPEAELWQHDHEEKWNSIFTEEHKIWRARNNRVLQVRKSFNHKQSNWKFHFFLGISIMIVLMENCGEKKYKRCMRWFCQPHPVQKCLLTRFSGYLTRTAMASSLSRWVFLAHKNDEALTRFLFSGIHARHRHDH